MLAELAAAVPGSPMRSITFLGVTINLLTADSLLDLVAHCIRGEHKIVVANHNLHSLCLHSQLFPRCRTAAPILR